MAICLKHEFGGLVDKELFGVDWYVESYNNYKGQRENYTSLSVQI